MLVVASNSDPRHLGLSNAYPHRETRSAEKTFEGVRGKGRGRGRGRGRGGRERVYWIKAQSS